MRIADRVVVVTGGTAGIGLAVAARTLEEGAKAVVVTGRDTTRGAAAEEILGRRASYQSQDVTDEEGWSTMLGGVLDQFGRVDILVNNAGWIGPGAVQDIERLGLDDWRRIQQANLDSVFLGCRAAIAVMKENGGAIVNLSSTAGLMGTPAYVAYGAAKAGVAQLTKSVALHCARRSYGIRCNSVHPAIVDTAMKEQIFSLLDAPDPSATYLARVPLGVLATADDVAAAVVYLASDDARYVTGAHLVVGGGLGV